MATFHATEAGPLRGLAVGAAVAAGALGGVVAGQPGRRRDHLLGRDARRGGRAVRGGPGRDHRGAQRHHAAGVAGAPGARDRGAAAARDARCCSPSGGWSTRRGSRTSSRPSPASGSAHPGARLAVAGTGSAVPMLVETARAHRVRRSVTLPRPPARRRAGRHPRGGRRGGAAQPLRAVRDRRAGGGGGRAPAGGVHGGRAGRGGGRRRDRRVVRARRRPRARHGGRPGARRPARGGAPGPGRARPTGRRLRWTRIAEETAAVYATAESGGPAELGRPEDPDGQRVRRDT